MKDKKIIFMGTPDIAAQHLNILFKKNLNIVGVFTQPPRKKIEECVLKKVRYIKLQKKIT